MRHKPYVYILFLILGNSCAPTLDVQEIKNIAKTKFDPFVLKPDREINNLRLDLIRQTYDERVNDSISETADTPYHPVGFDLGNGLFYDLNDNLCLRIDYLMKFTSDKNFELHKINRPDKNKGKVIYRFHNDSLTVTNPPRKKVRYFYHRIAKLDTMSYMYNHRMKYAIIETDSLMTYMIKRKNMSAIHKLDENQYCLKIGKRKENYQISGNEIFLNDHYTVHLTNDDSTLVIQRKGKRKNTTLYTIEKSEGKIFIYNEKYFGTKIEIDNSNVWIYRNSTLLCKYELRS